VIAVGAATTTLTADETAASDSVLVVNVVVAVCKAATVFEETVAIGARAATAEVVVAF
jgi:hypothetical protein